MLRIVNGNMSEFIYKTETDSLTFMETNNGGSKTHDGQILKGGKRRKLVLHFDIRNTVLVADSVTNVSMEQALNSFLTGVAWGRSVANNQWQWECYTPSLGPPAPGTMTFYKYLENSLVKTPRERTLLRIATGDFTQTPHGEGFLPVFKSHLKHLRWKHPDVPKLTMHGQNGKLYHYILPSVYRVIQKMTEENRNFSIVFRTYGLDAKNVISSLSTGLSGKHPHFPTPIDLDIKPEIGSVQRQDNQETVFSIADKNANNGQEHSVYVGDRDIYDMLSNTEGICGFKDDFCYWQDNNYHHRCGKPLYIDPFDPNVHHIFFDDNIRTFEHDSIVDMRVFESQGCQKSRSLSNVEAAKFEHMCMVQADLLEAIKDVDYYVKTVNRCEEKYAKYVNNIS